MRLPIGDNIYFGHPCDRQTDGRVMTLQRAIALPRANNHCTRWHLRKNSHTASYKNIEKVQMTDTKLLASTRNLTYEERLKILRIPTLKDRGVRGEMIALYKIISRKQDKTIALTFNTIFHQMYA